MLYTTDIVRPLYFPQNWISVENKIMFESVENAGGVERAKRNLFLLRFKIVK